MMKQILAYACLLSIPVNVAYSASFDCSKAKSYLEETICSNSELSRLDEELADAYQESLRESTNPKGLKAQQRAWIQYVRNQCIGDDCLKRVYSWRINDLHSGKRPSDWVYDGNKKLQRIVSRLEVPDYFAKHGGNVEYCKGMLAALKNPIDAPLSDPIVVSGAVDDVATWFPKCSKDRVLRHNTVEARDWELVVKHLPPEEQEESGTRWFMWRNFLLYKIDIDNNPANGEELVLYGAGTTNYGGERADYSHFFVFDPGTCKARSSAQVMDVIHRPDSFVGVLSYKGKNFIYGASYYPKELSYSVSIQQWEFAEKTGIAFFSRVCSFTARQ